MLLPGQQQLLVPRPVQGQGQEQIDRQRINDEYREQQRLALEQRAIEEATRQAQEEA